MALPVFNPSENFFDPLYDSLHLSSKNVETHFRLDWRRYARSFRQPLRTTHGVWDQREGLVVRLEDEQGSVGFGEIAPLPWFGSETLDSAIALCTRLSAIGMGLTRQQLARIPDALPACQFGLAIAWSALYSAQSSTVPSAGIPESAVLLPTGVAALDAWEPAWSVGSHTFKWKIGVESVGKELCTLKKIQARLPNSSTMRLDANGGLSVADACCWLDVCATDERVEFLEQPLPPSEFVAMQALSDRFPTPLALDESVATLAQLMTCHQQGWRDVFVVKPAIAGSPYRLQALCHQHHLDVVVSSVFETAIARNFLQNSLLPALPTPLRAPGLGTARWFPDDGFETTDFVSLWQRLTPSSTTA
ncbi:MAG: o-succinylbenzoate synthase [Cyanobacteria bacterium J06638_22]